MKDKILKPSISILIVYGLLISPIILAVLYSLSFKWFLDFDFYLIPIYILLIIIGIKAFLIDRKFQTGLKKYIILTITLMTIYVLMSYPTRDWMIRKSEEQGEKLGLLIQNYKAEKGSYPDNLNSDFFSSVPKRSYVGTKFNYEKHLSSDSIETCYISYFSFGGYWGSYSINNKTWHYYD